MKNIVEYLRHDNYASGELAGSATAVQMPDVTCHLVWFKAVVGNAGNVYIGTSSGVTVVDGTTDNTTGYELDAGEALGPLPCANLNEFWRITDNAGDDLVYLCAI